MAYVTLTFSNDVYATLEVETTSIEEVMKEITENKEAFIHKLLTENKGIDDYNGLDKIEITGVY